LKPKSYNKEILKNYLFSFSNLFLRTSLNLIAIPILSDTPDILAIYSVCISFGIFFRYSDFGFIAAGKKYAAEHVISKDFNMQLSLLGNSFSISFLISLIFSVLLFIISFTPEIIIPDLENNSQYSYVASILLKTLSISCIFQVFSNYITSFFDINLKKYYFETLSICSGLVLLLVFLCIDKTNQDWILTYYITLKVLDFIVLIALVFLINKTFKIRFLELLFNFRIRFNLFVKGLKLSFTSIITSVCALIFYELDNLFLAQKSDLISISFYSVAALGPFVIKLVFSLLYSPFNSIFNYLKNKESLYKDYIRKIIIFFFPLTFTGIITIVLFSEELIFSYVGSNFLNSIWPFRYLCLAWSFSFIIHPTAIYFFSLEFNKRIILCGLIPPTVFWVLNFYHLEFQKNISIETFCLNKLYSSLTILPFYLYYLLKDNILNLKLIVKLLKSLIISSLILSIFYYSFNHILFNEKNMLGLIFNILLIGGLIFIIKLIDLKVNKNQIDLLKKLSRNTSAN
jgi:O-antigen/teichoic acid export membrane protein